MGEVGAAGPSGDLRAMKIIFLKLFVVVVSVHRSPSSPSVNDLVQGELWPSLDPLSQLSAEAESWKNFNRVSLSLGNKQQGPTGIDPTGTG